MNDSPNVEAQARFGAGGEIEVDEEVETTWSDWGVETDTQERETRYEEAKASEFGVDDRDVVKRSQSEQESLFVDVEEDQQTLGGGRAAGQSRWE